MPRVQSTQLLQKKPSVDVTWEFRVFLKHIRVDHRREGRLLIYLASSEYTVTNQLSLFCYWRLEGAVSLQNKSSGVKSAIQLRGSQKLAVTSS